jgi:hypothetical protein
MPKYIISIVALIAVAAGAWFFLGRQSVEQLQKEAGILLYVESGDVSYRNSDQGPFIKATSSPIEVANDSFVYTGKGKATILFPNNSSVALDEYTELRVHYDDHTTTIYQTLGTTYHRVEALVTGATYEVETPGTVASVRGTKFAVKFDKTTKTTKVAVTEHKVLVSKFAESHENGTTTRKTLASTEVTEGSTAKVEEKPGTSAPIDVVSTETEVDMKVWVDENRTRDEVESKLKEERSSSEVRTEIKAMLTKNEDDASAAGETKTGTKDTKTDTPTPEAKKEEPRQETPPKTTETPSTTGSRETKPAPTIPTIVKKLDYETFFDKFNTLFFDYFYLDDNDTPCTKNISGSARVSAVTTFAIESGYPFTSRTLLDFSQSIDAYCSRKDASLKAKLKTRFDDEFPYQDSVDQ